MGNNDLNKKNEILIETRGISFEEIINEINTGNIIDIVENEKALDDIDKKEKVINYPIR